MAVVTKNVITQILQSLYKFISILDEAIHNMLNKTRNLRKQLRKAVVDHVSDGFLEPDNPLLMLIEAARYDF